MGRTFAISIQNFALLQLLIMDQKLNPDFVLSPLQEIAVTEDVYLSEIYYYTPFLDSSILRW
jgi:hypothetical protein